MIFDTKGGSPLAGTAFRIRVENKRGSKFFTLHLIKDFLAIHNVDALLHLVQTLASEIKNGSL